MDSEVGLFVFIFGAAIPACNCDRFTDLKLDLMPGLACAGAVEK